MRTLIFDVPGHTLQALVTEYADGRMTLAFRAEKHHSWGKPLSPREDWRSDLDSGMRTLPDHMRGVG